MDLLTRGDLQRLARRDQSGIHVSLFIPTHRFGAGIGADRIRWKNLLKDVESVLAQRGVRPPEIADLLAPAWALHDDALAWQYMSDGLALFLRPNWHQAFRVPVDIQTVATVGDHFVIGPLLRIVSGNSHFLLLALSQREVRLMEGSLQHVEELELGDIPTSLREVIEPPEPRSAVMARLTSSAGAVRAGRAVFYGHGATDEHVKQDELRQFVNQVAQGLGTYLGDQSLPMILVGLDHIVATYREVNTYRHLSDRDIRENPDQLSIDGLHAAAWPIVEEILDAQSGSAVREFEARHGTGLASNDADEIGEAARDGRVRTLLVAAQPWCWEQISIGQSVAQLGTDDVFAHCELLDSAAAGTLSQGGDVYALDAAEVPGGGDIAAVFRY